MSSPAFLFFCIGVDAASAIVAKSVIARHSFLIFDGLAPPVLFHQRALH